MIVLKIGGSVVEGLHEDLIDDIGRNLDKGSIIVHGGGRLIDSLSSRFGMKQRVYTSVSGFKTRITDEQTLDLIKMVFAGKINKEVVSALLKHGLKAIGLSGVDGWLILAKRKNIIKIIDERGRKIVIHDDLSGRPIKINVNLLKLLISQGYIPVVAPIGISENGIILNLDGDRVAARIAGELGYRKLVILTDIMGVMVNGKLVKRIKAEEIDKYIEVTSGGMKKKLFACKEALSLGVREIVIASALRDKPLERAIRHLECTVITSE